MFGSRALLLLALLAGWQSLQLTSHSGYSSAQAEQALRNGRELLEANPFPERALPALHTFNAWADAEIGHFQFGNRLDHERPRQELCPPARGPLWEKALKSAEELAQMQFTEQEAAEVWKDANRSLVALAVSLEADQPERANRLYLLLYRLGLQAFSRGEAHQQNQICDRLLELTTHLQRTALSDQTRRDLVVLLRQADLDLEGLDAVYANAHDLIDGLDGMPRFYRERLKERFTADYLDLKANGRPYERGDERRWYERTMYELGRPSNLAYGKERVTERIRALRARLLSREPSGRPHR